MIPFSDALGMVLQAARALRLKDEHVPLLQARGRVLAEDVHATVTVPRFANSAMDGFAVMSAATPGRFAVVQQLVAGDEAGAHAVTAQHAVEIMTGAPMPPGADAVVKVEDVRVELLSLVVDAQIAAGAYVRAVGEDYAVGDRIVDKGAVLTPERLLALGQCGIGSVSVKARPRIAIIPTGRELENPGDPLPTAAALWSSSALYLASALEGLGCVAHVHPIVRDDPAEFLRTLERAADADIVLTTGAVSQGVADFIPATLVGHGARARFHKMAVRPAKPVFFAELGGRPVFGLPGNPISTAVAFRFLVWPAIAAMLGVPVEKPTRLPLLQDSKKPFGLRCFFKADVSAAGVTIAPGQGSHLVRPLANCNAWAVLDEDSERLPAGMDIDVYPLQPRNGF